MGFLPGWGGRGPAQGLPRQSTPPSACKALVSGAAYVVFTATASLCTRPSISFSSTRTCSTPWAQPPPLTVTWACSHFAPRTLTWTVTHRGLWEGSHSATAGESAACRPAAACGKLSKSDEQLSSLDRDSGQCSRNTSCETLGEPWACISPPPASHFLVAPVRSDGEASRWLC